MNNQQIIQDVTNLVMKTKNKELSNLLFENLVSPDYQIFDNPLQLAANLCSNSFDILKKEEREKFILELKYLVCDINLKIFKNEEIELTLEDWSIDLHHLEDLLKFENVNMTTEHKEFILYQFIFCDFECGDSYDYSDFYNWTNCDGILEWVTILLLVDDLYDCELPPSLNYQEKLQLYSYFNTNDINSIWNDNSIIKQEYDLKNNFWNKNILLNDDLRNIKSLIISDWNIKTKVASIFAKENILETMDLNSTTDINKVFLWSVLKYKNTETFIKELQIENLVLNPRNDNEVLNWWKESMTLNRDEIIPNVFDNGDNTFDYCIVNVNKIKEKFEKLDFSFLEELNCNSTDKYIAKNSLYEIESEVGLNSNFTLINFESLQNFLNHEIANNYSKEEIEKIELYFNSNEFEY